VQVGLGSNQVPSPTRVTYKKGGNHLKTQWYKGKGGCIPGSHGGATSNDSDEYPFYTTKQVGKPGFNRGVVSLRPIPAWDN